MRSAGYFRPGRQPPECTLEAEASSQESTTFTYILNLKGLQKPLSILLHPPVQVSTSTQG